MIKRDIITYLKVLFGISVCEPNKL